MRSRPTCMYSETVWNIYKNNLERRSTVSVTTAPFLLLPNISWKWCTQIISRRFFSLCTSSGGTAKTLVTRWEFPGNDTQSLFRFCVLAHQEGLNPLCNGFTFLGGGGESSSPRSDLVAPLPGSTIKRPAGMHPLSTNPYFGRKEITMAVPAIRVVRISSHCPRHFFLPPTHFPPSNLSEELGFPPQSEKKKKKFRQTLHRRQEQMINQWRAYPLTAALAEMPLVREHLSAGPEGELLVLSLRLVTVWASSYQQRQHFDHFTALLRVRMRRGGTRLLQNWW